VPQGSSVENLASRTRRAGDTHAAASIAATFGLVCCTRSWELGASSFPQPFAALRGSLIAKAGVMCVCARDIARKASTGAAFRAVHVRASVLVGRFVWRSRPNRSLKWDAPAIAL
jgi:hypothetical protein